MKFKGTCTIDKETVNEVSEIMCERIRVLYSMISLIAALTLAILYLVKANHADQETRIVMAIINIAIMGGLVWISKRSLKKTYGHVANSFVEQVRSQYQTDSITRTMEFEDSLMTMEQDGHSQQHWLTNLLKVYETKNQLVLQMDDNQYLWIAKTSVEGGTVAEFKEYLKKYEKNK